VILNKKSNRFKYFSNEDHFSTNTNTAKTYTILMSAVENAEKYTVEEFIAHMEKQGYKWIDFKGDNKRHKQWYHQNKDTIEINPLWHFNVPDLIF